MKIGKEFKIKKFKNYKVVYGTVNKFNTKSVYIDISSWVTPLDENIMGYNRVLRNISKSIKQVIYNYLLNNKHHNFNVDKTIVDFDVRESGIKFGKRSFMDCEITLFSNSIISTFSEKDKEDLDGLTYQIIKNIFEENNWFSFHKRKK